MVNAAVGMKQQTANGKVKEGCTASDTHWYD
jgi:hypothetical protein